MAMVFDRNENRKVAVLLGAGCMGTSILRRVCAGMTLLFGDISEKRLDEVKREYQGYGYAVETMVIDANSKESIEAFAAKAADLGSMNDEQLSVLYAQARYCQAMTDADIDTMRGLVSEDMTYIHMSGMTQTREEYFADIDDGSLRYFTIGMDSPKVEVSGDTATITYTSLLNANAYGARGTYRMKGTHYYEKRNGEWIAVNTPDR